MKRPVHRMFSVLVAPLAALVGCVNMASLSPDARQSIEAKPEIDARFTFPLPGSSVGEDPPLPRPSEPARPADGPKSNGPLSSPPSSTEPSTGDAPTSFRGNVPRAEIGNPSRVQLSGPELVAQTAKVAVRGELRLIVGHDNCPVLDCWGNSPIASEATFSVDGQTLGKVKLESFNHGSVSTRSFPVNVASELKLPYGPLLVQVEVTGGWGEHVGANFRASRFEADDLIVTVEPIASSSD